MSGNNDQPNPQSDEQQGGQPPALPPNDKSKDIIGSQQKPDCKRGSSCDNPIHVKDCKPKGWKRPEIISLIPIGISVITIIVALANLKAIYKNFQKGNQPYLQISDLSLQNFGEGHVFRFGYRIDNIGNYTVKITKRRFGTFIQYRTPTRGYFDSTFDNEPDKTPETGEYLNKSNTDTTYFYHDKPLTAGEFYTLMGRTEFIFFMGVVEFKNLITEEDGVYKFLIRYTPSRREYLYIYNDNYP